MTHFVESELQPGRVYRTNTFSKWDANPTRLAKKLVAQGTLVPLSKGLYVRPKMSKFGRVPPEDTEVMRGYLQDDFVLTGPDRWNALGLGTTAVHSAPTVYNRKRSGRTELAGRSFNLRRVNFPSNPPPEWYVVDLFEHAEQAGASRTELSSNLQRELRRGRFDSSRLTDMAERFGTKDTRARIKRAVAASH
jgi:hypothetical protein